MPVVELLGEPVERRAADLLAAADHERCQLPRMSVMTPHSYRASSACLRGVVRSTIGLGVGVCNHDLLLGERLREAGL